jgi:hypothetical protein
MQIHVYWASISLHLNTVVESVMCILTPKNMMLSKIPIVRGATAVQDQDTGETHIMIINEGMWYGNRMNHSLINPNQLRHFQIEVCDNLFDKEEMHLTVPPKKPQYLYSVRGQLYMRIHMPLRIRNCKPVVMLH